MVTVESVHGTCRLPYTLLKDGKDVLIVGHGMMNLSIISQIRNIPIEKFWSVGIEQCKLIKLI